MASYLSFLDFPAQVRQRIYAFLLAPYPDENETVINYELRWNWLENPSNTTFGGIPQIDLCRCPREEPRIKNSKTKDHMYTRYKCNGPQVKFKGGREDLWVPSPAYASSGQINFLRPAREEELGRRPNANIMGTCRKIYEDALPILYRGRNFLFITGPCPRGRYQAYAAQRFFARLSTFAREHVTAFSLIIVPHEEDCRSEDVVQAYGDLVAWVQHKLPSFHTLGINLWHVRLTSTVEIFGHLFQKDGIRIELDRGQKDGWVEIIEDVESLRAALLPESHELEHTRVGPTWKELQKFSLPRTGKVLDVTPKPEKLLGKWRGKEQDLVEESYHEGRVEDSGWIDASPTPLSSTKKDVDGWEVI